MNSIKQQHNTKLLLAYIEFGFPNNVPNNTSGQEFIKTRQVKWGKTLDRLLRAKTPTRLLTEYTKWDKFCNNTKNDFDNYFELVEITNLIILEDVPYTLRLTDVSRVVGEYLTKDNNEEDTEIYKLSKKTYPQYFTNQDCLFLEDKDNISIYKVDGIFLPSILSITIGIPFSEYDNDEYNNSNSNSDSNNNDNIETLYCIVY